MQEYRPIFLVVTFGFLGLAFYLTYRPRRGSATDGSGEFSASRAGPRAGIMKLNRILLWVVTVLAVVFLFAPQAITSLVAPGDEFTAEMERTVISIEGMT